MKKKNRKFKRFWKEWGMDFKTFVCFVSVPIFIYAPLVFRMIFRLF